MSVELSAEVRKRLDGHLDAVEQALVAAGNPRERRRGVVDDLESQILDMLGAKSTAPTLADLEEVLAKLDPPASYRDGGVAAVVNAPPLPRAMAPKPRFSRMAIWGLVCIIINLLAIPLILIVIAFVFRVSAVQRATEQNFAGTGAMVVSPGVTISPETNQSCCTGVVVGVAPSGVIYSSTRGSVAKLLMMGACFFGPLGLLGTILGWVAVGQVRTSKGALRGMGLALFDGLFYPVAIPAVLLGIWLLKGA